MRPSSTLRMRQTDMDFARARQIRQTGFADATHVLLAAQTWGEGLLADIFRLALAAPPLRCMVVLSRRLPRGWTERISELATSFGHAVAVSYLPTTCMRRTGRSFACGGCPCAHTSVWRVSMAMRVC
jgi:hypothetical protein